MYATKLKTPSPQGSCGQTTTFCWGECFWLKNSYMEKQSVPKFKIFQKRRNNKKLKIFVVWHKPQVLVSAFLTLPIIIKNHNNNEN